MLIGFIDIREWGSTCARANCSGDLVIHNVTRIRLKLKRLTESEAVSSVVTNRFVSYLIFGLTG